MRIVKVGTREAETQCLNCRSALAYTCDDVKQDIVQRHGEWYARNFIVCPVCGVESVLSYNNEHKVSGQNSWYICSKRKRVIS